MCRDPLWRLGPYLLGIWLIISWAATEGVRCHLNGRLETLFRPHCCEKRFHFCFVVGKHRREHEQNTSKKKKKTGHNQMRWLVTWVNAFLHVFLIHWQKEKRQKKNTTNDGDCCTKCAPGLKPVLEYWTQTNKLVFFFIWACLYTESVWTEITISNHCFIIIIIIVMVSLPFNSEENVNKWQLKFTF